MQPVTVRGNFFFEGEQRFTVRGLAYQPVDGQDPLSDDQLDVISALVAEDGAFTRLSINTIRVYQVDPGRPHDQVMALLAARGIRVLVGAVNAETAIRRDETGFPERTVQRVKAVLDAFSGYDNVLAFSVANELLDDPGSSQYRLPGLVKEVAAHARTHQQQRGYRAIPIGAAVRDVPAYTIPAAMAYACGADRLDFLAYNSYRWGAGGLDARQRAWLDLLDSFSGYPIPVILGEYGSTAAAQRDFSQVPYLLGQRRLTAGGADADFAETFSGGVAFRYFQRSESFGLVDDSGTPIPGRGFEALGEAYGTIPAPGGTPRQVALDCDPDNPYAREAPLSGLPTAITITVDNAFADPARKIAVSIKRAGQSDFTTLLTLPAGSPPTPLTLPVGTTELSVAFFVAEENRYYSGCVITDVVSALSDGVTLTADFQGGGFGACAVAR